MSSNSTPPPEEAKVEVSRGFPEWLRARRSSLAFSSYQSGKLFLIGLLPDGRVSMHQQNYARAMGLCAQPGRLYVGALNQVWRLENTLAAGERANQSFDHLYTPRNAQTVGDVDIHELGVDRMGRVIFVNTKYSCLATFSPTYSFRPVWKPPFISKLAAEDRCHLNGLAMEDGVPRYVTAVSQTDVLSGWRARRGEGGVIIDVTTDKVLTDQLSMPHSPRLHDGTLWALDSGRGYLIRVDRETGGKEDIAFCPGFLRGLSFIDHYAIVTVSLPREGAFKELGLQDELAKRDGEPWCGVLIIDTRKGDIVEFLRLSGEVKELFDVAVLPGVVCPMAVGIHSPDLSTLITVDAQWAPLGPPA